MGLSYTMTPFHPTTVYPDQVTIELNLANQNFTTLAQIFMNNDPTTLQLKPSVGGNAYANPINLSSQTTDYLLEPGQVGVVSFSSQSLIPLNVAVPQPSSPLNPVMYELEVFIVPVSTWTGLPFMLYPNNTTYQSQFQDTSFMIGEVVGNLGPTNISYTTTPYSYVNWYTLPSGWSQGGPVIVKATISYAGASYMPQITGITGALYGVSLHNTNWFNNGTSWTSLGSIGGASLSGALSLVSGFALVRRLA